MQQVQYKIIAVFLAFTLFSCGRKKPHFENTVSVSILPQKYFVERITGNKVNVNVMIPPGASPATYEPKPSQLKGITNSNLYLSIGHLGFEKVWLEKLTSSNPQMKVVNLSQNISLIKGIEVHGDHTHEGGIDPHIWSSPRRIIKILPKIKDALIELYPAYKDTFQINYLSLLKEVKHIDKMFTKELAPYHGASFMLYHPVLSYIAEDYGLNQISIEHEGKEPSAKRLKNTITIAREQKIKVIFIQKEFSKRSAQLIAQETGAAVVEINPLAYNWSNQSNLLLEQLIKAFSK